MSELAPERAGGRGGRGAGKAGESGAGRGGGGQGAAGGQGQSEGSWQGGLWAGGRGQGAGQPRLESREPGLPNLLMPQPASCPCLPGPHASDGNGE